VFSVDRNEIEANITALEQGGTTWRNVEKYALLCIARDNLTDGEAKTAARTVLRRPVTAESYATGPQSDFVEAAREADFELLLDVLDEHMDAIHALYPKEYAAVLRKLKE